MFVKESAPVVQEIFVGLDLVVPVDFGAFIVKSGGRGERQFRAHGVVVVDFGRDGVGAQVAREFFEVGAAFADKSKSVFEVFRPNRASQRLPGGLISKEIVGVFFPVALETGGVGGGGRRAGVGVVREEVVAENDGDATGVFFEKCVHPGINGGATGALVVGVFIEDELGGFEVAFHVFFEEVNAAVSSLDMAFVENERVESFKKRSFFDRASGKRPD